MACIRYVPLPLLLKLHLLLLQQNRNHQWPSPLTLHQAIENSTDNSRLCVTTSREVSPSNSKSNSLQDKLPANLSSWDSFNSIQRSCLTP